MDTSSKARSRAQELSSLAGQAHHVLLHPSLPDADKRDALATFIQRIDILSEPVAQKQKFTRKRITGLLLTFHSLEREGEKLRARYENQTLTVEPIIPPTAE